MKRRADNRKMLRDLAYIVVGSGQSHMLLERLFDQRDAKALSGHDIDRAVAQYRWTGALLGSTCEATLLASSCRNRSP